MENCVSHSYSNCLSTDFIHVQALNIFQRLFIFSREFLHLAYKSSALHQYIIHWDSRITRLRSCPYICLIRIPSHRHSLQFQWKQDEFQSFFKNEKRFKIRELISSRPWLWLREFCDTSLNSYRMNNFPFRDITIITFHPTLLRLLTQCAII